MTEFFQVTSQQLKDLVDECFQEEEVPETIIKQAKYNNLPYFTVNGIPGYYLSGNRILLDTLDRPRLSKQWSYPPRRIVKKLKGIRSSVSRKGGCTNFAVDDDGFCTQCGEYHWRDRQQHSPSEPNPVQQAESDWVDDLEGTDGFSKKIPQGGRIRYFQLG